MHSDLREPDRLPGRSSLQIVQRGWTIMIAFGCLTFALAFESKFKSHEGIYIGILAPLEFIGLTAGLCVALWGNHKTRREVEAGYTVQTQIATQNPELFLLTYKTLEILSRPHEPRPGQEPNDDVSTDR